MAGVAIAHVNLQQGPFFLRDVAGVVEGTEGNELVMELRIHRVNRGAGAFSYQFSHSGVFLGKEVCAQPLEATIVVMAHVAERLIRIFRDFAETIPFKEMKF